MSGDDNEVAVGGEAADPIGSPPNETKQEQKPKSTGQVARDAAAAVRAARAKNDAEYAWTDGNALRVKWAMRNDRSLKSLAASLKPPHGITLRKLWAVHAFELNYGADEVEQSLDFETLAIARHPLSSSSEKLQALKNLKQQNSKTKKEASQTANRPPAEPEVVVVIKPSLGNSEPTEHE